MPNLSRTMLDAHTHAGGTGGSLCRTPGGFWIKEEDYNAKNPWPQWFGTPTVNALVTRGAAEYTEWQQGRNGRFPIKCTMKALRT